MGTKSTLIMVCLVQEKGDYMETKLLSNEELEELCGGTEYYSIRRNSCGGEEVVVPLFGDALPDLNLVFSRRIPISVGEFTDNKIPCSLFSAFPPFSNGYSRLRWRITVDNLIQGDYIESSEEFNVTASKPTHTLLVMRYVNKPVKSSKDGKDILSIESEQDNRLAKIIDSEFCEWTRTGYAEDGHAFVSYVMFRNK